MNKAREQSRTQDSQWIQAVILAGGKGTRLGSYSYVLPKPLMPVDDKPILEIILSQLHRAGIREITITVGHLAHLIRSYFGDGDKLGLRLHYSQEQQPLGTAGPLTLLDGLDNTFLVSNGDVLTDLDPTDLIAFHQQAGGLATIACHQREVKIDFGVMELDPEGRRVTDYLEKPTYIYPVSMGMYVFEPKVLDYIPKGEYFDFPDLVLKLIEDDQTVTTYPHDGYWRDLGRLDDYASANRDFSENRSKFLPEELE